MVLVRVSASWHISQQGKKRFLFGFDSFSGFPAPTEEDKSEFRTASEGEWSHRNTKEAVRQLIGFGIDMHDIENSILLVQGFVEESLARANFDKPIAFVHIDLDLYSGYWFSLNFLWDLLNDGAIVCFDEYGEKKWPGATLAIDKFCEAKGLNLIRHECGKYYLTK